MREFLQFCICDNKFTINQTIDPSVFVLLETDEKYRPHSTFRGTSKEIALLRLRNSVAQFTTNSPNEERECLIGIHRHTGRSTEMIGYVSLKKAKQKVLAALQKKSPTLIHGNNWMELGLYTLNNTNTRGVGRYTLSVIYHNLLKNPQGLDGILFHVNGGNLQSQKCINKSIGIDLLKENMTTSIHKTILSIMITDGNKGSHINEDHDVQTFILPTNIITSKRDYILNQLLRYRTTN